MTVQRMITWRSHWVTRRRLTSVRIGPCGCRLEMARFGTGAFANSLLLTADPKYRWLNRLHCLGVGEVRIPEYFYTYDMYAVR